MRERENILHYEMKIWNEKTKLRINEKQIINKFYDRLIIINYICMHFCMHFCCRIQKIMLYLSLFYEDLSRV